MAHIVVDDLSLEKAGFRENRRRFVPNGFHDCWPKAHVNDQVATDVVVVGLASESSTFRSVLVGLYSLMLLCNGEDCGWVGIVACWDLPLRGLLEKLHSN